MDTSIEPIEQHFGGTAEELKKLIDDYIIRNAPRTRPLIGESESLELIRALNDPNLYFVVRYKVIKDMAGKGLRFDSNPRREGTLRIKEITDNPPRAEFFCRPYTEAAKRLGLALTKEIKSKGYEQIGLLAIASNGDNVKPKIGRPHLPDDFWAWQQVNKSKRPKNEVYKQWFIRINHDPKRSKIKDPQKHFNRITKFDWY